MSNKSKYAVYSLLAIETVLIVYFSIIPYPENLPGEKELGARSYGYLLHLAAYSVYGGLWEKTLKYVKLKNSILIAILISSAFGGLNEILQAFVPNRYTDILDFGMDAIGAGIGAFIVAKKIK